MAENKVCFGLKKVYYAKLTETVGTTGTTYAWGTPTAIPGAVNLSLDQEGSVTPFYADNMVFYQSIGNNGYSGDLEVARFPDSMLKDIWGYTLSSTDKTLVEKANVEPASFALLYQIDGDQTETLYALYKCTGTRPAIGGETIGDTKEPKTQTSSITAVPLEDYTVLGRTTDTTTTAVKTAWFTQVYRQA